MTYILNQPRAKAKGARKRLARHANSRQNGRGKYQHTGPFSFWRTSQRHVLDRAQPPTLQQGGSPMFIVLLGWTLAAMSTAWCYDLVLLRSVLCLLVLRLGKVLGLPEECGLQ